MNKKYCQLWRLPPSPLPQPLVYGRHVVILTVHG